MECASGTTWLRAFGTVSSGAFGTVSWRAYGTFSWLGYGTATETTPQFEMSSRAILVVRGRECELLPSASLVLLAFRHARHGARRTRLSLRFRPGQRLLRRGADQRFGSLPRFPRRPPRPPWTSASSRDRPGSTRRRASFSALALVAMRTVPPCSSLPNSSSSASGFLMCSWMHASQRPRAELLVVALLGQPLGRFARSARS